MNKRWRKRKDHAKCILCKPYWFCMCAFERTSTSSQQSHCQTLSRTVSWKLARDINWHPASATSALSFSLGWEPRGSVWSTAKTTALLRILAFCLDKPCWKESWRAKIVCHWKGNPPSKFDRTVAMSWWFCFGLPAAAWFIALRQLYVGVKHWISPCQVLLCVKCLHKSQQSITVCQTILIRNVFESVSFADHLIKSKKNPTTSALWDSVASFRSHWILVSVKKHQTHKLVYLMGQHWPCLGLLPSGHQCREFAVIQQVSTPNYCKLCEKNMRSSSYNHFLGPKRSSERLSDPHGTWKKKRWNYRRVVLVILSPVFRCKCCSRCCPGLGFCMAWLCLARCKSTSLPFFSFLVLRMSISYVLHVSDGSIFIHIRTYFTHDSSIEFSRNLRMDL